MNVVDYLKQIYNPGDPIFSKDIHIGGKSKTAIRKELSLAVKKGKIKRQSPGIYYLTDESTSSLLSFTTIIYKKYICDDKGVSDLKLFTYGYYTGMTFLNYIGLSQQVPAIPEIVTNKTSCKRRIHLSGRTAILRKPKVEVTYQNCKELQFIDMFYLLKDYEIEENKKLILDYMKDNLSEMIFEECLCHYEPTIVDKLSKHQIAFDSARKFRKITIVNNLGLMVVFTTLGAAIYQIIDNGTYLTRNASNDEDFAKPICYYGKTIGRTANRIKGSKVVIDGKEYKLDANENGNVLHGGLNGLSNQVFDYVTREDKDSKIVEFTYLSKHLESGYPGNLNVKVTYTVSKDKNQIVISYQCTTDETTLCSLTNHSYFTLGSEHINELSLKLDSDYYLDVDKQLIATSKKPVDAFFDFRKGKKIPPKGGIDHFFYLNNKDIVLSNDKYRLTISSNFEGCQVYTSNGTHPDPLYPECNNTLDSVAIEPSDSHLDLHFLKRGETYSRYIIYNIERLKHE